MPTLEPAHLVFVDEYVRTSDPRRACEAAGLAVELGEFLLTLEPVRERVALARAVEVEGATPGYRAAQLMLWEIAKEAKATGAYMAAIKATREYMATLDEMPTTERRRIGKPPRARVRQLHPHEHDVGQDDPADTVEDLLSSRAKARGLVENFLGLGNVIDTTATDA